MPARLILNADDFGLTHGINRAIAELHAAHVLTSATLMATGPAFADAVAIAHANPTLGVGCHIILTDGIPASPPASIPTLIGPDHKTFRPKLSHFLRDLFLHRIDPDDIAREAIAQIARLLHAGIHPTHLDTHKHTHLFPAVTRPLLDVAERMGIHALRNPFEPAWCASLPLTRIQISPLRRLAVRLTGLLRPSFGAQAQIRSGNILTTDGTLAISATGHLTSATLAEILRALPPTGTYELCCHPGYNDQDLVQVTTRLRAHRNLEREALLAEIPHARSPEDPAAPNAPQLIHYGTLEPAIHPSESMSS